MTKTLQALLIALMAVGTANADFTGEVVGVTDGDTVTVLRDREPVKVRLTEIDAPERKQPFGQRSRQHLADLVFRKEVLVVEHGKDRYGRTLGRLKLGAVDANEEQIRSGMAWVYDKYVVDRSLYGLQDEAKRARRGLWADPEPVPPWEWRRSRRGGK
ncbi:MAG: thermonuclease family protein [Candidatus Accumulibacter sp.]|nr:thermonuclease family protein [Accumulibacter sp.]